MKEAYCSYEVSKLLKEKGFDEYGLAVYSHRRLESSMSVGDDCICNSRCPANVIAAPSHQMAMAWLREKHDIYIAFDLLFCGDTVTHVLRIFCLGKEFESPIFRDTIYENAVEGVLRYALEKLI